ncbi:amidohydrolase/deacetylase family metallohydrolase [Tetragenococcus koreensis]|uniref:amidohydrolase/deacetylase family metallohydrolase n=1 Tax=Tetragenococcus koreensis TaxID=290335 RepID=UPI001F20E4D3|nr:amidohydrolase/deacetylase family metallohydrolase [Tetragenococcus koreensis]MDN5832224.1 amidohydrolase/deacetylase family metallohydrolase [Tetragenococcus halophilus]MCF1617321.1 amidohydrolase/deacetylase family metallohydrolase [Tetragenococcus koreensis]MCF1622716.1 amidohydrolase/deacetylase family metallohydrolase [Tetragenococcus koreensis]MCF1627545.1 amidohydrolase/deacetylase family metallohydrolase [Tetragenococcus koreensis]MCF1632232.1 amidohydrolase/deacetylase family metal
MEETVLKGGKLITGETYDVAFKDNKITQVAPSIDTKNKKVINIDGKFISAGWIDDHVHCFEKMSLYYDFPDQVGVEKGVTTVIDAGTTGAENITDFYQLAKKARTNVFAMVNISKTGIVEQDELADLTKVKEELVTKAIQGLPEFIVGIKARMSKTVIGDNGITPLALAKKIQEKNHHIPLMVHIGSAPPELNETLSLMGKGDVLTHCFNGKSNGILNSNTNEIKDFAKQAYDKGVVFDIGHGTDSFNFNVAEVALKEGIKAKSISTDIYIRNRKNGPVYDMGTTLEKLHVTGYSWGEIIEKITVAPADNFNLSAKGKLEVGYDADVTVFDFISGEKELTDSNGFTRNTNEQIQPFKTVIGGQVYDN